MFIFSRHDVFSARGFILGAVWCQHVAKWRPKSIRKIRSKKGGSKEVRDFPRWAEPRSRRGPPLIWRVGPSTPPGVHFRPRPENVNSGFSPACRSLSASALAPVLGSRPPSFSPSLAGLPRDWPERVHGPPKGGLSVLLVPFGCYSLPFLLPWIPFGWFWCPFSYLSAIFRLFLL